MRIQSTLRVILGLALCLVGAAVLVFMGMALYGGEPWEANALVLMGMPLDLLAPLLGVGLIGVGLWLMGLLFARSRVKPVED